MFNELIINLLITVGIIGAIIYLKYARRQKPDEEFTRTYIDILNSEKYKVKGKFED